MDLPLNTVRVVDLSKYLPGPYCSSLLAGLGAEVIKVEPVGGEEGRMLPQVFWAVNWGKKSVTLNLKRQEGKDIFFRLVEKADVVIEGFRPGVADRLGVGFEQASQINPRLIYCSISGYGQDGPYRDWPAHAPNVEALSGLLFLGGEPPSFSTLPLADLGAGMTAAIGILAALLRRERTGKGSYVDIAMFDVLISLMGIALAKDALEGGLLPGSKLIDILGSGVYETADGRYLALAVGEERPWSALWELLGMEQYKNALHDDCLKEEIHTALSQIFKTRTCEEWTNIMKEKKIPCAPVNSLKEVRSDPQVIFRKMINNLNISNFMKDFPVTMLPIKYKGVDSISSPANLRVSFLPGEQNEEVLLSLGYTREEITFFQKEGII